MVCLSSPKTFWKYVFHTLHPLYESGMARYIGADNSQNRRLEDSTVYKKKLWPKDCGLEELLENYYCEELTKYTAQRIRTMHIPSCYGSMIQDPENRVISNSFMNLRLITKISVKATKWIIDKLIYEIYYQRKDRDEKIILCHQYVLAEI